MKMIKINKNSWHYKVVNFGCTSNNDISNNLCTYFWQFVRGCGIGCALLLGVILFIVFASFVIGSLFVPLDVSEAVVAMIIWIVIALSFKDVIIHHFGSDHWLKRDVFKNLKSKDGQTNRKPSIIKEYLKAKKQKICPIIEFE